MKSPKSNQIVLLAATFLATPVFADRTAEGAAA